MLTLEYFQIYQFSNFGFLIFGGCSSQSIKLLIIYFMF